MRHVIAAAAYIVVVLVLAVLIAFVDLDDQNLGEDADDRV